MKLKKRAIYHLCLLCICILCIVSIYYWRQHTMYTYPNEEVYINKIFENEIFVKGLPYQQGTWEEEYIIQINSTLEIKDSKGGMVDIHSLNLGDILLFDYTGPKNSRFSNGTILNGKKVNAHNFRLSEDKLNLKLWRLE